MSTIGENVKQLMKAQKVGYYKVAQKAGLSHFTIRALLKGETQKPTRRTIENISYALGVTPEELNKGIFSPEKDHEVPQKDQLPKKDQLPQNGQLLHQEEYTTTLEKLVAHLLTERSSKHM